MNSEHSNKNTTLCVDTWTVNTATRTLHVRLVAIAHTSVELEGSLLLTPTTSHTSSPSSWDVASWSSWFWGLIPEHYNNNNNNTVLTRETPKQQQHYMLDNCHQIPLPVTIQLPTNTTDWHHTITNKYHCQTAYNCLQIPMIDALQLPSNIIARHHSIPFK